MRTIEATRGIKAMVDDDDYLMLSQFSWHADSRGYIVTKVRQAGILKSIYMHRLLMGVSSRSCQVDHINHNKYDNRRCNLRVCDNAQNHRNRLKPKSKGHLGYKSIYKGVSWHASSRKWRARISLMDGTKVHLGVFESEKDAAAAYDKAALQVDSVFYSTNSKEGTL